MLTLIKNLINAIYTKVTGNKNSLIGTNGLIGENGKTTIKK